MDGLLSGLATVFQPLAFFYCVLGTVLGIAVGAIPGLTGAMLIALTLPLTYYMTPTDAVVLLISMYVGAITGGLITESIAITRHETGIIGIESVCSRAVEQHGIDRFNSPYRRIGYLYLLEGIFFVRIGDIHTAKTTANAVLENLVKALPQRLWDQQLIIHLQTA